MAERREGYVNKNHIIQPLDLIEPDFQRDPEFIHVREVLPGDDHLKYEEWWLDELKKRKQLETQLAELRGAVREYQRLKDAPRRDSDERILGTESRKDLVEAYLRLSELTESESGDVESD